MILKKRLLIILTFAITLVNCNNQNNPNESVSQNKKEKVIPLISADTTSQLMKEDDFWNLIDKAKISANDDYQSEIGSLKTILLTLDPIDIEKFENTFTDLLARSYDYKLWGASFVINDGCSDDCFEYFRQYLIGHGKEKFYQTLKDPESCATWIKSEEEDNWEGLLYAAQEVYKQKTGKDMPQVYHPQLELKGKPFDEATVSKQYPKLAKKFMSSE